MSVHPHFSGKTVVVTGATAGIGRAIVDTFAMYGSNILFCARTPEKVAELESILTKTYPRQHFKGISADMSLRQDIDRIIAAVADFSDQVHFLINNAGVFLPGSIATEEPGVLEKLTETNVYSAYHLTRGLIPYMIKQQTGHIFMMCSTASITAYTNGGSYCITKFALLGMAKVLRQELKSQHIKVTAILPGATYTDSWQGTDLPRDRFMEAQDVADAIIAAAQLSPSAVIEEILLRPMAGDI